MKKVHDAASAAAQHPRMAHPAYSGVAPAEQLAGLSEGTARSVLTALTPRQRLLAGMDHPAMVKQCIAWAHEGGWKPYAMHDSRTQEWDTDPGWPDLVLFRGERKIAGEVKTGGAVLDPNQREWARVLKAAGFEVYTWRPEWGDIIYQLLTEGVSLHDRVRRANLSASGMKEARAGARKRLRPSKTAKESVVSRVSSPKIPE